MKTRRLLYLILGIALIALNVIRFIVDYFYPYVTDRTDLPFTIGVYIGKVLFFMLGVLFLRAAYRIETKIKDTNLVDGFLEEEKQQNRVG
ncbi:MAG TPA: hypothetical protein VLC28_01880 [Flavitalea sp.]|nr:hypothetical protein [Flavitalea sp.]